MRLMIAADASHPPLDADAITIRAVQFVGTNVEMTYLLDAPADRAEPGLDALLRSRLGLYALTWTGEEDGRQRFSVIASPLDRLFHKVGPSTPLTVIKHTSVTIDLSETNLERQGRGLVESYPGTHAGRHDGGRDGAEDRASGAGGGTDAGEVWRPWDAGKLLGTLIRRPTLGSVGAVTVAGVPVEGSAFPHAILPTLREHVARHGGVWVAMEPAVREALAG